MALDINHYNALFLDSPGQNDAAKYGVKLAHPGPNREAGAGCTRGEDITFFRCIGIHHLTPDENAGNHHIYLDVLNEQGQRMRQTQIEWTWDGRQLDEPAPPVTIDKPDTEPGTNIPLNWAQTASVSVQDNPTDTVTNLHTRHPDEGDNGGNTRGHHSFYVVFQLQSGDGVPPPTQPPPTEPPTTECEQLLIRIAELDAAIDVAASKLQDVITILQEA
jgi:hypothetical protein